MRRKMVNHGKECLALVDWIMYSSHPDRKKPLISNPLNVAYMDLYTILCSNATGEFAGAPDAPELHLKVIINNGVLFASKHQFDEKGNPRMKRVTYHYKVDPKDKTMVCDGLEKKVFLNERKDAKNNRHCSSHSSRCP
jgi:hypothetical protein